MAKEYSEREKSMLSIRRQKAYSDGEYELDDDEGFKCPDCGLHDMSVILLVDDFEGSDEEFFGTACTGCRSESVERVSDEIDYAKIESKLDGIE